ncbi:MAG: hypothetical protein WCF44_20805 [Candidatus Methylophosphatis roskildensis]
MRIADDVTTRLIEGQAESEPPQSAVVIGGSPSGTVVPGAVLEAAVRADGCWLLFMTDGTPFEEMLSIHPKNLSCRYAKPCEGRQTVGWRRN